MAFIERRGKAYRVRYRSPDGRERCRSFKVKADARAYLISVEDSKLKGVYVDPRLARVTVADWSQRYMACSVHLAPNTLYGYRSLLDTHLLPAFGDIPIGKLDRLLIQEWVSTACQGRTSNTRIRQAVQLIRQMLNLAVEAGHLGRNPANGVRVPKDHQREQPFLDAGQVAALASACREYEPLIYTFAYAGLRFGEAVAARRTNLDVRNCRLHITESASFTNGQTVYGPTKNHQRRTVALPRFLASALDDGSNVVALRADRQARRFLFQAPRGGPVRHASFTHYRFKPAVRAVGLPETFRIHDLRHTCVALLVAAGAHPKAIQCHLGHSSIRVTLDMYGHLFPEQDGIIAEALERTHASSLRTAIVGSP